MKKFRLIFAGCLAFVGILGAHADDIGDAVRAAGRIGATTATVTTRKRSDTIAPQKNTQSTPRTASTIARGTATGRGASVVNRATVGVGTPASVVTRATTNMPQTRAPAADIQNRSTRATTTRAARTRSATRAATTTATRADILSRNYSKCRDVFNECMDEFCANKDSQLKRCACSSRIAEFDKIKRQLENIDEKMLDFNQRLLTVSMDKEDAAALNIATEGEKAFYDTRDTSESKRALDAIAKKLNTSFDSSNFSTSLGGALSWSLDIDSAFDNVNSLAGASTTAKSGVALYSAALPVCREIAAEVCSDEDISLAENSYQLLIAQDCNTVEKTFKTTTEQARNKVLESSALLDISRLNVYQKNNADDILTCKRKMLAMLTDSTVCGADLGKCLDITGQYIDPSTGQAFLSTGLVNLDRLITRPDAEHTWTSAPGNSTFVTFLNSKKKFLEPAMENCVDIADAVWDAFVEDALSQIKIAQTRKLEDVRQSCTTLTAQCLTDTAESLTDFDARALSTFGVAADLTVNAMCENVLSSCTTLLNATTDTDAQWETGITGIQTDITYDTIIQTCTQVGRACVIQVCTSTSGNFGLCENIDTSINRKSIINHTACWDQVLACVESAGDDAINRIFTQNELNTENALYSSVYDIDNIIRHTTDNAAATSTNTTENNNYIYDMCNTECGAGYINDTPKCRACRLAENIWGNCEAAPATILRQATDHNRIKKPAQDKTTLLYWFAQNTNTEDLVDNCRDTTCPVGFVGKYDSQTKSVVCIPSENVCLEGDTCETSTRIDVLKSGCNCCPTPNFKKDKDGFCIQTVPSTTTVANFTITEGSGNAYYNTPGDYILSCVGTVTDGEDGPNCEGYYIIKREDKHYISPNYGENDTIEQNANICETYKPNGTDLCKYTFENDTWKWLNGTESCSDPKKWVISFDGCKQN